MAQRNSQNTPGGSPYQRRGSHFSNPQPQQQTQRQTYQRLSQVQQPYARANASASRGGAYGAHGAHGTRGAYAAQGACASPYGDPSGRPPKKGISGTTIAAIILMIVGVGLLVTALVIYMNNQRNYQVGKDEYSALAQNVTEDSATSEPIVDFAALKAQNPEVVGWIQIPDTPVNYPIAQHSDNDYYLEHTFTDQFNLAGSVFLDYRSDAMLGDRTTVIYGHHLQNGEMFARIADYSAQAEFDTVSGLYYVTEDGAVHDLVPLCCLVVDGYETEVLQFEFSDDASFASYVQSLIDRSSARAANATSQGISHVYLLSTCSYERENDRTILVAVDRSELGSAAQDATQNIEAIREAADEAVIAAGEGA